LSGAVVTARAHFLTVRIADVETSLLVAVMVTLVVAATRNVEIGTLADRAPAGTVTFVTIAASGWELVKVTRRPPAGAGPDSVTEAADDAPPMTLFGLSVSFESAGGFTVSGKTAVVPP
jgi:hypothetical protein